jgi:hypothetical protein
MTKIQRIGELGWTGDASESVVTLAARALEGGDIILLAELRLDVEPFENVVFTPRSPDVRPPGGKTIRGCTAAARLHERGRGVSEGLAAEPHRSRGGIDVAGVHRSGDLRRHVGSVSTRRTFLLPIDAMQDPERSPLRVLERIKRRQLS